MEEHFARRWQDPSFPGAFAGANYAAAGLAREAKHVSARKALDFLRRIPSYAQHVRTKKVIDTRHVDYETLSMNHTFQADLIVMPPELQQGGFSAILVLVDVFDGFCYARPLRTKGAGAVRRALKIIFKKNNLAQVDTIATDAGGEFVGLKAWFKRRRIKLFILQGRHKAFLAERTIKKIKHRLWPYMRTSTRTDWYNMLDDIVLAINLTPNRGINYLVPADVHTQRQESYVRENRRIAQASAERYRAKPTKKEFAVGDLVFVEPKIKSPFYKSFHFPKGMVYRVSEKNTDQKPYMYKVVTEDGTKVARTFYAEQMEKGPDKVEDIGWPIEHVVSRKTDKKGVKWIKV